MPRCVWAQAPAFERGRINGGMADLNTAAVDVLAIHLADSSQEAAATCAGIAQRDKLAAHRIMIVGFNQESLADQLARAPGLTRAQLDAAIAAAPPEVAAAARSIASQAGWRRIDPVRTPSMKPIFAALGQETFDGPPRTPQAYMISAYVLNAFQLKVLAERYVAAP